MSITKLAPDQALEQIAALLSDKAGSWNAETTNRVAEIITSAGFSLEALRTEPTPSILKCPHCGCVDPDQIRVIETYRAYHPVRGYDEDGVFALSNALGLARPFEAFDDGDGDFIASCNACSHSDDPEKFGMGDCSEWVWWE